MLRQDHEKIANVAKGDRGERGGKSDRKNTVKTIKKDGVMRTGRHGLVCLLSLAIFLLGGGKVAAGQNVRTGLTKRKKIYYPLSERRPPVIKPSNGLSKPKKKHICVDEGVKIVDGRCRIQKQKSGWIRMTVRQSGRKSQEVLWGLPNGLLEEMERIASKGRKMQWTLFRVSGVIHVYRGKRFLLVTRAVVAESVSRKTDAAVAKSPGVSSQPTTLPAVTSTVSSSALSAAKSASEGGGSSASNMMASMLRKSRCKPIFIRPNSHLARVEKDRSIAPLKRNVINPVSSMIVVDRLVTIDPAGVGRWKVAAFESDNTLQEPPVRLLPCSLLQQIEKFKAGQRLRVTGEIYIYKGRSFMLIRKAVKERDLGRF